MGRGDRVSRQTARSQYLLQVKRLTELAHERRSLHHFDLCPGTDDAIRFPALKRIATIEKAMVKLQDLAGKADLQSANQLNRWITVKEEHASNIQAIVPPFFLAPRKVLALEG